MLQIVFRWLELKIEIRRRLECVFYLILFSKKMEKWEKIGFFSLVGHPRFTGRWCPSRCPRIFSQSVIVYILVLFVWTPAIYWSLVSQSQSRQNISISIRLKSTHHFTSRRSLFGATNALMDLFFRVIGMRNTPYVAGRRINLVKEILPVAAPSVTKQIVQHQGQFLSKIILPTGVSIFMRRSSTSLYWRI